MVDANRCRALREWAFERSDRHVGSDGSSRYRGQRMMVRDEWEDKASFNEGGNTGNLLVLHVQLGMRDGEIFLV